jgi:hypothetical protein
LFICNLIQEITLHVSYKASCFDFHQLSHTQTFVWRRWSGSGTHQNLWYYFPLLSYTAKCFVTSPLPATQHPIYKHREKKSISDEVISISLNSDATFKSLHPVTLYGLLPFPLMYWTGQSSSAVRFYRGFQSHRRNISWDPYHVSSVCYFTTLSVSTIFSVNC